MNWLIRRFIFWCHEQVITPWFHEPFGQSNMDYAQTKWGHILGSVTFRVIFPTFSSVKSRFRFWLNQESSPPDPPARCQIHRIPTKMQKITKAPICNFFSPSETVRFFKMKNPTKRPVAAPKAWAARETCLSLPLYTWKKTKLFRSKAKKVSMYCHLPQWSGRVIIIIWTILCYWHDLPKIKCWSKLAHFSPPLVTAHLSLGR